MKLPWKAVIWLAYLSNHLAFLVMQYALSTQGWTHYASHFDWHGKADAWSSISPNTLPKFALFYLVLSLGFSGLMYVLPRILPRRFVSLPHPEFYKQSPHFERAMEWCFYATLGIQSIAAAQLAFTTYLTLVANHSDPVAMKVTPLYTSSALALAGIYGSLAFLVVKLFRKRI